MRSRYEKHRVHGEIEKCSYGKTRLSFVIFRFVAIGSREETDTI